MTFENAKVAKNGEKKGAKAKVFLVQK